MEVARVLHMNKGGGDSSYAKNSTVQLRIISVGCSKIEEGVKEVLMRNNEFPERMEIADLGCSSGPNTLKVVSEVIDVVYATSRQLQRRMPELRVALNDLAGNDFNDIFVSLPDFYRKHKKDKGEQCMERCFIYGVPASFYGRLFPCQSQHFIHSSSSLHWLSQVPGGLERLNKGKIYISNTSPPSVTDAYLSQFQKDFRLFLSSRAAEMVPGGNMVLSFLGRRSPDAASEESCYQWELLARALMSMANEGLIDEEKIDSFNAPYYAPRVEEVKNEIKAEGSFIIKGLDAFEIEWDASCPSRNDVEYDDDDDDATRSSSSISSSSSGEKVSRTIRAVVESMLESHFGSEIMDDFFSRFARIVDEYFCTRRRPFYINLVMSLTRTCSPSTLLNKSDR